MRTWHIGRVLPLTATVLALSLTSGVAQAKEQKGAVTIDEKSFHVDGESKDVRFVMATGGLELQDVDNDPSAYRCFATGVDLPKDARPIKLKIWARIVSSRRIFLTMKALDLPSGVSTSLFDATVGDGKTYWRMWEHKLPGGITPATKKTAYGIAVCIGAGDQFSGARVEYLIK